MGNLCSKMSGTPEQQTTYAIAKQALEYYSNFLDYALNSWIKEKWPKAEGTSSLGSLGRDYIPDTGLGEHGDKDIIAEAIPYIVKHFSPDITNGIMVGGQKTTLSRMNGSQKSYMAKNIAYTLFLSLLGIPHSPTDTIPHKIMVLPTFQEECKKIVDTIPEKNKLVLATLLLERAGFVNKDETNTMPLSNKVQFILEKAAEIFKTTDPEINKKMNNALRTLAMDNVVSHEGMIAGTVKAMLTKIATTTNTASAAR